MDLICVEYLKGAGTNLTSPETDQVERYVKFQQLPSEEIEMNKILKQPNNDISSLQSNFRAGEVYQERETAPMKRI